MTSIAVDEDKSGLPAKLSEVAPEKIADTVKGIQRWTGNAIMKVAQIIGAVKAAETHSALVLERLRDITTGEMYAEYIELLKVAKGKIQEFEGSRTEVTGPINDALRRVNDLVKDGKAGWEAVVRKIDQLTSDWRRAEVRRQQQEAERIRLEQLKAQEQARIAAEKKADKLEEKGLVETADAVRETATGRAPPPAGPVYQAPPKVAGHHVKVTWHARIINEAAVPDQWKMHVVNLEALEAYAKATEGKMPMAGVEFYTTEMNVTRAARK